MFAKSHQFLMHVKIDHSGGTEGGDGVDMEDGCSAQRALVLRCLALSAAKW